MRLLLVEDHAPVRRALREGLEATGEAQVIAEAATAREAIALAEANGEIEVALMDVELRDPEVGAEAASGVGAAVAIRRERPRLPVVFYSIQDDDAYYREFRARASSATTPTCARATTCCPRCSCRCCATPSPGAASSTRRSRIACRRCATRTRPRHARCWSRTSRRVAELLAQGLTNEQIAARLGFRDARAVSRTNGQIYAAWGLNESATDEKVARTRATLIYTPRPADHLGRAGASADT